MPGMVDAREHRAPLRHAPVVVEQLGERLVRAPAHAVVVERVAHLVERAGLEPRGPSARRSPPAPGSGPPRGGSRRRRRARSAARCSPMPVASTSDCHWLRLIATTITRRPSRVGKSRPNAPYMSLPSGGRFAWVSWAWPRNPRLATMVNATSASEILTSWPSPVAVRSRSPASIAITACNPVAMSHAGQRVVHGERRAHRTGGEGDARRRVHRVVDRGGLVGVADDVHVDEVGAAGAQPLVGEPARTRGSSRGRGRRRRRAR